MDPINVSDFEALARERMSTAAFDYYSGAAGDERTLAENRAAFGRITVWPRVLVDVSRIDTSTTVLGQTLSMPIGLAPTAFNKLAHPDGERAAARAAGAAGTLMTASTISTCTLEETAEAASGPLWFQLYVYKDRGITRELVARAESAGYRAIALTVDTPVLGRRERDVRNGFVLPPELSMRNLETCQGVNADSTRWSAGSSFSAYVHGLFDTSLSWSAVEWLQSLTRLPVLLKGILRPDDARRAVEAGVAGIVVSNHGGRQLDGAPATIDALPPVVSAVEGRVEVLLDGGIRRGVDVLKAVALGARAVLIGRPYLWALAAAGEDGVKRVLDLLRTELVLAMALAGAPTIREITRDLVSTSSDPPGVSVFPALPR
ncbi:MAG: alpha-hydroxy-acid oxidizing protein [Acidobacteria bacterium]|nr:alpha-hydroxy-acid oxidizing protein [Acidobacteriota bacterium]